MKILRIPIIVLSILALPNMVFSQFFEKLNGPKGVYVTDLAVSAADEIYITGRNFIYKSSDHGETWEKITDGIPDNIFNFSELTASPDGDMYVLGGNMFFRLPAGEDSWVSKSIPDVSPTSNISVTKDGDIYVCHRVDGLYHAESGTAPFEKIAQPAETIGELKAFGNGLNFLMTNFGTGGKIFRFADDGSLLEELNPPLAGSEYFRDLDLLSNGKLLLSTSYGVRESEDGGDTWTYNDFNGDGSSEYVDAIHIQHPGILYFLTEKGVFYSDDYGETSKFLSGSPYDIGLSSLQFSKMGFIGQDHIYFSHRDQIFTHSSDNGLTWERLDKKFPHPIVEFIQKDFQNNLFVLTTSPDGFEKSSDDGETWEPVKVNGERIEYMGYHENGDWFATIEEDSNNRSIMRSSDQGATWIEVSPDVSDKRFREISILPGGIIFVNNFQAMHISKDLGATWNTIALDHTSFRFPPDLHPNGNIYIGSSLGSHFSEDGGDTWQLLFPDYNHFSPIHIAQNGKIYMPGYYPVLGTPVTSVLVYDTEISDYSALPFLPGNPFFNIFIISDCENNLILTDGSGVFLSLDEGNSWINLSFGLEPTNFINRIYYDESYLLYLGMNNTVVHRSKEPTCDFVKTFNLESLHSKIKISPNPMSDFALIEIDSEENLSFSFNLFDSTGKIIRTEKFNSNQHKLQKENLTSGIYFYQIESENQILKTGKLIVR